MCAQDILTLEIGQELFGYKMKNAFARQLSSAFALLLLEELQQRRRIGGI
jgi:hypothetical protein